MERAFFTFEQVRDIFRAGVRAGENGGPSESDFASELYDIANDGLPFGSPARIVFDEAAIMFAKIAKRSPEPVIDEGAFCPACRDNQAYQARCPSCSGLVQ